MFKFLQRRREEAERQRREAAVAACRAEVERICAADPQYLGGAQDATSRAALLETARREGAGDAEAVRQLDCLQRLLAVLPIQDADAATTLSLVTEAENLGLSKADAVRALAFKHALAELRRNGPEEIDRDADGRAVYLRCLAAYKNGMGVYQVRKDGIGFLGEVRVEIPWTNVAHVAQILHETSGISYRAISIQEGKRRTATRFVFHDRSIDEFACELTATVWRQFRATAREAPPQPAAPRTRPAQGPDPTPVASADFTIQTTAGAVPAVRLPGTGRGLFFEVAGESHYQEALRALTEAEPIVRLTAEPENPHDANAVAIQSLDGAMLGYMPREQAARYQQLVLQLAERGLAAVCQARLIGGTAEKPSVGVLLDLEVPTIVASKLGLVYRRVSR